MDSHEWNDVVMYGNNFLRRMASLGFINSTNVPTDKHIMRCLPIQKLLIYPSLEKCFMMGQLSRPMTINRPSGHNLELV